MPQLVHIAQTMMILAATVDSLGALDEGPTIARRIYDWI
jgi:hypothetical protein